MLNLLISLTKLRNFDVECEFLYALSEISIKYFDFQYDRLYSYY